MGYTIETEIGGSYGPAPWVPAKLFRCQSFSVRLSVFCVAQTNRPCRLLVILRRAADEPQDALEDTYLRLYDIDGETILDENDDELVGKESLIHWMCPKSGCDALG